MHVALLFFFLIAMAGRDRGILQYFSQDASSSSASKRPSSASTPTAELTFLETGLASSPLSCAENAFKKAGSAIIIGCSYVEVVAISAVCVWMLTQKACSSIAPLMAFGSPSQ